MSIKVQLAQSVFGSVARTLGRIKLRTWVIIGAICLSMIGLLVWAMVALFGAALGGAKNVLQQAGITTESVQQASGQALASTQTLLAEADKKLSAITAAADIQSSASALEQSAKQALASVSSGVAASAAEHANAIDAQVLAASAAMAGIAAGANEALAEAREVSGADIGPTRFPGLRRTAFQRTGDLISVGYQGSANLSDALAHYQAGFTALGYRNEVLFASAEVEQHVFVLGEQRTELKLSQAENGLLNVELKQRG
jgi:hypothetical protein